MTDRNILKTSAVIIAAGFSSRMHDFKPLLALSDKTVLETTVSTFTEAGIQDIVVVVGHKQELLIPLIEALGLKWVINHNYEYGMFSSIQTGIRSIDPNSRAFFMMPVDVPLVRPDTIKQLMSAYDDQGMDVMYPSFDGRRGHPPLITSRLIPELISSDDQGGLKQFLESHGKPSYLVVSDPGILIDIDTEEAYNRVKQLKV